LEKKILIAYYTHSNNTEKLAKAIQNKTGGVLHKITLKTPYPSGRSISDQAKKEIDAGFKPELVSKLDDAETYDVVFVGSPNWWYTIAPPVTTFLSENDFAGKVVVPFYTHGGGGAGSIEEDIAKLCEGAKIQVGLSVYGDGFNDAQIDTWLKKVI